MVSIRALFYVPDWPLQKSAGFWRMTADYTAPIAANVPDGTLLVRKITKASHTWHVLVNLANVLFPFTIKTENQKQVAFMWAPFNLEVSAVHLHED